jgi:hypothetical protein
VNSKTNQVINTAALASVVFLAAPRASAERISFNLPIRTQWGTVILEPGKYTFEIPLASSWPQQILLTQNGRTVRIFPMIEAGGVESNHSYLLLVDEGGSYFVREYISGITGKVFTFTTRKKSLHTLSTKAPDKRLSADSAGN